LILLKIRFNWSNICQLAALAVFLVAPPIASFSFAQLFDKDLTSLPRVGVP
jgi:hypothetical protein